MNIYLDSNALVKLYHTEAGTAKLVRLLDEHADDLILTIADITRIEFYSVFFKRIRKKELLPRTAKEVFSSFEQDLSMFNIVDVDNTVKQGAVDLLNSVAHTKGLTTLDALQLAASITAHQMFPIDSFVTSDRIVLGIAKEYFPVFNPEA